MLLTARMNDEWLGGEKDGRKGMFPISFVVLLEDQAGEEKAHSALARTPSKPAKPAKPAKPTPAVQKPVKPAVCPAILCVKCGLATSVACRLYGRSSIARY